MRSGFYRINFQIFTFRMRTSTNWSHSIDCRSSRIGRKTAVRATAASGPAKSNSQTFTLLFYKLHQLTRFLRRQHGWPGNPAGNVHRCIFYMWMMLQFLHQLFNANDFLRIVIPHIHSSLRFTRYSIDSSAAFYQSYIYCCFFTAVYSF